MPTRVQNLHSLVAPIRDADESIRIHRHARGTMKLAFTRTRRAQTGQMCTLGVEFLNAVIAPIRDVDLILGIRGNPLGQIELPCPTAMTTPLSQELPLSRISLHPVVEPVRDQEVPIGVKRQTGRAVTHSLTLPLHPPLVEELAVLIKDGNAVQSLIGDVESLFRVHRNRRRPHDLAVLSATMTEFAVKLLAQRAHRYPLVGHAHRNIRTGAIEHIEHIVTAQSDVYWIVKAVPNLSRTYRWCGYTERRASRSSAASPLGKLILSRRHNELQELLSDSSGVDLLPRLTQTFFSMLYQLLMGHL